MARASALFGALAVALAAQRQLDAGAAGSGATLAVLALAVFGLASRAVALPARDAPAVAATRPSAWSIVGAGVLLAALGTALLEPNGFTAAGTPLWLAGLATCLAGLWRDPIVGGRVSRPALRPAQPRPPYGHAGAPHAGLMLAAILAVAALLRVYQLADLPAEAGPDIPLKLQIVRGILAGERPIFSTVYPGREVAFFYAAALVGDDQLALKLTAVAASLATVLALYALGARWFGRAVGLWAAAWLALSPWHVTISRIGFRGVLTPLMVTLALLALDRARTRGARRDWAVLGLIAGAAAYTYTAALAIALGLAVVAVADGARRRHRRGWAIALLLTALTVLPLVRVALAAPDVVTQRAGSRLSERPDYAVGERLLGNAGRSLAMFNWRGDVIAIQNAPFQRLLGGASGALFLCGLGAALARWREARCALILLFLAVMQLPSLLVLAFPDEVPGAVRASGALVPACLLAALPVPLAWRALRAAAAARLAAVAAAALGAALLAWEARETWQRYFVTYAAAQPFGNYPLTRTIAATIDAHAGVGPVILPGYPYWVDGNAVRMQLRRTPTEGLRGLDSDRTEAVLAAAAAAHAMVILRPGAVGHLDALRRAFPAGRLVPHRNAAGEIMFLAFYPVPPKNLPFP